MSTSTVQAQVRLGAAALAELRELARRARVERAQVAERRSAERRAEFEERGVAEASSLGSLTARVDALEGCLPQAEIERARVEIAAGGGRGALSAFGARVEALEREAERSFAVGASQRLVAATLAKRTGARLGSAAGRPGGELSAALAVGGGEQMPIAIKALPARHGKPIGAEQLVVFETANSNIDDRITPEGSESACDRQQSAVRGIAAAYGEEMTLEDLPPGGAASAVPRPAARTRGAR